MCFERILLATLSTQKTNAAKVTHLVHGFVRVSIEVADVTFEGLLFPPVDMFSVNMRP